MRVRVYTICWNESRVIDCFLRHYEAIAEHIVFYDEDFYRRHQGGRRRP